MKDSIIFDLDGTLWDARTVLTEAWNSSLVKLGLEPRVTLESLTPCMGLPLDKIADRLFPDFEGKKRYDIIEICAADQIGYLRKRGGRLYPRLEETLRELKKNFRLFIVSNCREGYIESFIHAHGLEGVFDDFEDNGRTGLLKADNIRLIVKRNGLSAPVYVGDTATDKMSAEEAGVPFIFAAYGFGEVSGCDIKINEFGELVGLMKEI